MSEAIERLLRRDRAITAAGLAVLCALAWLYLLGGAGLDHSAWEMTRLSLFPHQTAPASMADMAMPGMAMAAPISWSPTLWALAIAMWWTMMVAMMAASAAPAVLLYGRVFRHAAANKQDARLAPTGAFVAGYFLVWLGFALAATAAQWGLERAGLLSSQMLGSQSRLLSASLLAAAGLYQLSPLHRVCLSHCRGPAEFLTRHWRPGAAGAVRLGVMHGAYCVGCCWALMALLFVGGVMNLAWIAAIAVLVLAEKAAPGGVWVGRAAGATLLVWAAATLLV